MSKATRATRMLEQAGVAFSVQTYDYDGNADRIGLQVRLSPQDAAKVLNAVVAPLVA